MDKRRIGVRGIIWLDGKLLAVRHRSESGVGVNYYAVPGGGLDPCESLEAGLRRELMEELGVEAKVGRLLFMQQFSSGRQSCDEELEFFFMVENPEDFVAVDFSGTSHGASELTACEFINPASEKILPGFLGDIDMKRYIETVQPVLLVDRFHEND